MSNRGSWNALLSHPEKVERRPDRILDVGYPEKMERHKGDRLRVHGVGTPPPDDTERASLSGATPSGFPKRTRGALPYPDSLREKHTALAIITPRMIAYPIRICCPCYVIPTACHSLPQPTFRRPPMVCPDLLMAKDFKASILHVSELSIVLPWIPKNSPQSRIALVIKKLSKHQNLTQFD